MTSQLGVCPHLFSAFVRKLTVACTLYGEGRWLFHYIGQDYTVYSDYMDLAVRCAKKPNKLNHSPTFIFDMRHYSSETCEIWTLYSSGNQCFDNGEKIHPRWLICASMLPWSDMMLISTVALSKTLINCVLLHNMWQLDRLHADAENLKLPLEINTCM